MMDPDIEHFMNLPLDGSDWARAGGKWLPMGKLSAPRRPKFDPNGIDESLAPKASTADLAKRAEKRRLDTLQDLLAYYATTTVPFDRVATHTGLSLEQATAAMIKRGRVA